MDLSSNEFPRSTDSFRDHFSENETTLIKEKFKKYLSPKELNLISPLTWITPHIVKQNVASHITESFSGNNPLSWSKSRKYYLLACFHVACPILFASFKVPTCYTPSNKAESKLSMMLPINACIDKKPKN